MHAATSVGAEDAVPTQISERGEATANSADAEGLLSTRQWLPTYGPVFPVIGSPLFLGRCWLLMGHRPSIPATTARIGADAIGDASRTTGTRVPWRSIEREPQPAGDSRREARGFLPWHHAAGPCQPTLHSPAILGIGRYPDMVWGPARSVDSMVTHHGIAEFCEAIAAIALLTWRTSWISSPWRRSTLGEGLFPASRIRATDGSMDSCVAGCGSGSSQHQRTTACLCT